MVSVWRRGGVGYCASADLSAEGLARAASVADRWAQTVERHGVFDGLDLRTLPEAAPLPRATAASAEPMPERGTLIALLRAESDAMRIDPRIVSWAAQLRLVRRQQSLWVDASPRSHESVQIVEPNLEVTAAEGAVSQTRSLGGQYNGFCRQGGFEVIRASGLVGGGLRDAERQCDRRARTARAALPVVRARFSASGFRPSQIPSLPTPGYLHFDASTHLTEFAAVALPVPGALRVALDEARSKLEATEARAHAERKARSAEAATLREQLATLTQEAERAHAATKAATAAAAEQRQAAELARRAADDHSRQLQARVAEAESHARQAEAGAKEDSARAEAAEARSEAAEEGKRLAEAAQRQAEAAQLQAEKLMVEGQRHADEASKQLKQAEALVLVTEGSVHIAEERAKQAEEVSKQAKKRAAEVEAINARVAGKASSSDAAEVPRGPGVGKGIAVGTDAAFPECARHG
jgi:hypothetical protein